MIDGNGLLREATEELVQELLPVVLGRMRRATRRLGTCAERLARDPDGGARGSRSQLELERVQSEGERLGWALGVLGAAAGDDVLLARRDPEGLAALVELVGEVLAAEGRELEPRAAALPRVAPTATDGWRLPWAVALLLRRAARDLAPGEPVRWRLEEHADEVHLTLSGAGAEARRTAALVAALVPGARALEAGGLALPRALLAAGRARRAGSAA